MDARLDRAVLIAAGFVAGTVALVAAAVAVGLIPSGPRHGMQGVAREGLLWPLRSWDAGWYERIAAAGYPDRPSHEHAFFPLWPALLAAGGRPLGFAVAWLSAFAAVVGVARAAPMGRRAAVAFICLPASFSLMLLYPDALAVACAVWACVLVRRVPAAAALLGCVAAVARPNGVCVAVALLTLSWRDGRRPWPALGPLLGALAVEAWLWRSTGDAFAFLTAQRGWGRGGPQGLVDELRDLPSSGHLQTLVEVPIAILLVILVVRLHRGTADVRPYAPFAATVVAISLASGSFQSAGRQALLAFPLAFAACEWPRLARRRVVVLALASNAGLILALPLMAP